MKFIDSHCHLDIEPLKNEKEAAIERAFKAGVERIINVGSSIRGSKTSVELANLYPNIWATVGLHPHEADTLGELSFVLEELRGLVRNEKVVGIGEIGLDYFDHATGKEIENELKKKQKELFLAQLELAVEVGKPLVIHIRDAWDDFFEIIQNSKFKIRNSSEAHGVVHCFTGDEKIAKKVTDLGFYLGFTGFVTFEQEKFHHIREAVKVTPLEKIVIETDAPFLAPEPFRGKTNEPAYVVEVAKKIAELKRTTVEEVAEKTWDNAEKLFTLN